MIASGKMSAALACVAFLASQTLAEASFVEPVQHEVSTSEITLPQGMSDFTASVIDDEKVFLFGGCLAQDTVNGECTEVSDAAYMFNPNALTADEYLVELASAPTARYRHAAAALSNGKVIVVGGASVSGTDTEPATMPTTVDIYDSKTNTWSTGPVNLNAGSADGTAFAIDDVVYYVGGWDANWASPNGTIIITETTVDYIDAGLNEDRGDVASVVVEGEGFVVGGWGDDSHLNSVERFNPVDQTWTVEEETLKIARGDKALAALNNRLFVFGGQSSEDEDEAIENIEMFYQDEWRAAGELGDQRFRLPAATIGDTIYLFGGARVTSGDNIELLDSIIAYTEVSDIYSLKTLTLQGSGTTNPSSFFWNVFDLFHSGTRIPTKLTYRAIGSGDGQKEMLGDEASGFLPYTQFGSGDIPFNSEDYATISSRHTIAQFPFAFGAVSVYVNIPELREDEDRKLIITACGLAKIYNGAYSKWSELADEGPDGENEWIRNIDEDIKAVHRKSGSSSTSGITKYMNSECSSEWGDDLATSFIENWPCGLAGTCTSDAGSGGIQDYLEEHEYSIGYLSVSHGYPDTLSEITMINKNGDLVQASSDGIQKAADSFAGWPSSVFETFEDVTLIDTPGEDAWPIVLVSYIYTREDLTPLGSSAALLKAFLTYVLTEDLGQELMQDYSFVPLTSSVRAMSLAGLEALYMPADVEEFIFETDTQPYVGAGPYVISEKREFVSQQAISDLETKYAALASALAELESDGDDDHESAFSDSHVHGEIDRATGLAVAALVFAFVDFVVLVIVLIMVCKVRGVFRDSKAVGNDGRPVRVNSSSNFSQGSSDSASAAVRVV